MWTQLPKKQPSTLALVYCTENRLMTLSVESARVTSTVDYSKPFCNYEYSVITEHSPATARELHRQLPAQMKPSLYFSRTIKLYVRTAPVMSLPLGKTKMVKQAFSHFAPICSAKGVFRRISWEVTKKAEYSARCARKLHL